MSSNNGTRTDDTKREKIGSSPPPKAHSEDEEDEDVTGVHDLALEHLENMSRSKSQRISEAVKALHEATKKT